MQGFRLARPRRALPAGAFDAPDTDEFTAAEPSAGAATAPLHAPPSDADVAASRALQDAGNALADAGQFAGALREWERALKLTPCSAALHESSVRAAAAARPAPTASRC